MAPLRRGARGATPAGARLRRPALGRRCPTGLRRLPARLGARRTDPGLARSSRAASRAARPGWRQAQLGDDPLVSALRRREQSLLQQLLGRAALSAGRSATCSSAPGTRSTPRSSCAWSSSGAGAGGAGSVQGLIAARLDSLPRTERSCCRMRPCSLRCSGSARSEAIGGRSEERCTRSAQEFVRRERQSSVAGEAEYAFSHALVRDVHTSRSRDRAGEEAPAAAEWIESLARLEDHAEMIAHHYVQALEYADAAGDAAEGLADPAPRVVRGPATAPSRSTPTRLRRATTTLRWSLPAETMRRCAANFCSRSERPRQGPGTPRRGSRPSSRRPRSADVMGSDTGWRAPPPATAAGSCGVGARTTRCSCLFLEEGLSALGDDDPELRVLTARSSRRGAPGRAHPRTLRPAGHRGPRARAPHGQRRRTHIRAHRSHLRPPHPGQRRRVPRASDRAARRRGADRRQGAPGGRAFHSDDGGTHSRRPRRDEGRSRRRHRHRRGSGPAHPALGSLRHPRPAGADRREAG